MPLGGLFLNTAQASAPSAWQTATPTGSGGWISVATPTVIQCPSTGLGYVLYDGATEASTTSTWYQEDGQGIVWVTPQQYFHLAQTRVPIYWERTAEQQRLLEEQAAVRAAFIQEQQEKAAAVRERARQLLLSHLTPAQRATFEANRWFVVTGGQSQQRYRIRDSGHAGNVDVLNGERVQYRLCCHCDHQIPTYDNMLAQKITLEYDEKEFLRLANRHAA